MNHFTTASVFCIASLLATTNASAQHCSNGQCRRQAQPAASITNLFRLPGRQASWTPTYTGDNGGTESRYGACDSNGQNCHRGASGAANRAMNGAPHDRSDNREETFQELTPPRPQIDRRDSAVRAPRPSSGAYRPVGYTRAVQWEGDIRAAAERSRATGQPMLIQVTASWCGHCQRMKRETYTNASLINGINRDFIPVMLDADANRELMERMSIKSLPTTLVVLPDMQVAERLEGFQSAAKLQGSLGQHLQRAQLHRGGKVAFR